MQMRNLVAKARQVDLVRAHEGANLHFGLVDGLHQQAAVGLFYVGDFLYVMIPDHPGHPW